MSNKKAIYQKRPLFHSSLLYLLNKHRFRDDVQNSA